LPSRFTVLVNKHLGRTSHTKDLEHQAEAVVEAGLPDEALEAFVRGICCWGGRPGIATKVFRGNSRPHVQVQFQLALKALETKPVSGIGLALQEINKVWGLGEPSFASKQLRFLRPDMCPIFDSVISTGLHYKLNVDGYVRLARDCAEIARALERQGIPNPMDRQAGRWYVADVDMALYAFLKKW
jgi:hypothetical protein